MVYTLGSRFYRLGYCHQTWQIWYLQIYRHLLFTHNTQKNRAWCFLIMWHTNWSQQQVQDLNFINNLDSTNHYKKLKESYLWCIDSAISKHTFLQSPLLSRLTIWKNRLDKDPHGPPGRILAPDHTESQALLSNTLLIKDSLNIKSIPLGPIDLSSPSQGQRVLGRLWEDPGFETASQVVHGRGETCGGADGFGVRDGQGHFFGVSWE